MDDLENKIAQLEKENRILKREYARLQQDLSMLSNLADYASKLRNFNEERVVAANRAKSNFLANMSHEIRTPMNAIIGMDEMILRETKDPKLLKYALDIKSAGNTLLSIINDILDLSKIESGKMEIAAEDYEFASVLNDVTNMTMKKATDKGLGYELKADTDIPSVLCGDEIRIRQIMLNLINNAIKYTAEGGIRIHVSYDRDRERLMITVRDTGIGIRKEDMEKIYESFQRLEESKNRMIEGTGLGLNITKQLVELMNGRILVESEYGKGSVFSVEVVQKITDAAPIGDFADRRAKATIQMAEYKPTLYAPEASLLIVDDNDLNLDVISELLKNTGIRIMTALSGKECLEQMEQSAFDVVLLDQMMPGMSGTDTLAIFKEKHPQDNTPVIALTADAIVGARELYIKEGFTDYLSKPVMYEALEKILFKYIPADLLKDPEKEMSETDKPVALVICDSSERMEEIRSLLGDRYRGVYVRDEERAEKYLGTHSADLVIRDIRSGK